eukprot:COSAG02_NODE_555_length_20407_cov_11.072878_4_plen_183_part_00
MGMEGKYLILGLADAGKRTLLKHLAIGELETSDDGKVTSIKYKGIQLLVSSSRCKVTAAAAELQHCGRCISPRRLDMCCFESHTASVRWYAGLESGGKGLPWGSRLRGRDSRRDRDHVYGGLGEWSEPRLCLSQGAETALPDAGDGLVPEAQQFEGHHHGQQAGLCELDHVQMPRTHPYMDS